ncbi:hypothetical protein ACF08P_43590 [Streptomyces olivaceoviridis]|uniref:hypothetical protein n=1 Tax=Streptomyces olivaceoviridis TaxID=1921 RepID=UPI0036FAA781
MANDDLDTLLGAPYAKIDDEQGTDRWTGRPPRLTDSELICLAVSQALLGFGSEARWLEQCSRPVDLLREECGGRTFPNDPVMVIE